MPVARFFANLFSMLLLLLALSLVPALAGNTRYMYSTDPLKRGLELASRKYPEEAAREFDRCKDLKPATPHQMSVIATTYFQAGQTSSSLRVIEIALSQERFQHLKDEMADLVCLRGDVFASLNRRDEAAASYQQAATIAPEFSYMYLSKAGRQFTKSKRYKEALPLLRKSIDAVHMSGFAYQDIGHCYLELKAPAQAIPALTASIDSFMSFRKHEKDAFMPGLIQSYKYLIQAYDATGNKKEALACQKRLDDLFGDLNTDLFGDR